MQKDLHEATSLKGWDGRNDPEKIYTKWNFAGALLYAVTAITTIGESTHQDIYCDVTGWYRGYGNRALQGFRINFQAAVSFQPCQICIEI